jgi:hypothetical protein
VEGSTPTPSTATHSNKATLFAGYYATPTANHSAAHTEMAWRRSWVGFTLTYYKRDIIGQPIGDYIIRLSEDETEGA